MFLTAFPLHARAASTSAHGTHGIEAGSELWILLLHLKLSAGSLGVGDSVDDLGLGTGELGSALEVLQGLRDLALLQEQLSHGANGNITLGVDCERLDREEEYNGTRQTY